MIDKTLTPTKLSGELGISPSTLRKYSLLLEESGYTFQRNAKNSRQYLEVDVMAIREMITLIKSDGMTVENAAYAVSRSHNIADKAMDDGVTENGMERQSGDVSAVIVGEIRELKETVKDQQEIIDGFRLAQEKRDKLFVEILEDLQEEINLLKEQKTLPDPEPSLPDPELLREIEELQKEVQQLNEAAATKEEEEPEEKKGFFARWFK